MSTSDFAKESGHWYRRDGSPCYTLVGKNGNERAVTLRDARQLDLVPSVTTIIRCAAAPGLERWKAEQLMLAALTLPRNDDEPETDWLARVRRDSQEQAKAAAERGTRIHGVIERGMRGEDVSVEDAFYVAGVKRALAEHCGEQEWRPERSFAHPDGYGGKCDLHSRSWVIDYKTKEFTDPASVALYDEHAMQLAAYRLGLGVSTARCGIAFVSVTQPGLVDLREIDAAALQRGRAMFGNLLMYWQARANLYPMALSRETA